MKLSDSKKYKSIAILLSSFNGVKYLEEQVCSLLKQAGNIMIDIHIRDDGSKDGTQSLIKNLSEKYPNIYLYEAINVGVIASFLWLVDNISGYDYYAFCDQDDVWEPLKLMAAISKLETYDDAIPLAYCSAFQYVDCDLNHIGRFSSKTDLSIENLLIENCAPGCTMVFNSALREKYHELNVVNVSNRIVMHDWFFLLLASCYGRVVYDENSYLLYRQHSNNVVGIKNDLKSIIKARARQLIKELNRPQHLLYVQTKLISEICTDALCSNSASQLSNGFIESQESILSRLRFVLNDNVKRVKIIDDFIFKFLYVVGYYK
ncbi:alpha-L-Rha alpha-1,3-L-rhamnosyltransferase [Aeromonas caviae]|nr:alpha-L-Rha alpha-1,3-L-rhamnosyltransferase [Aeromonas caviae]GKR87420.1 alpha-L-Rha alpha-1,3-L-rhamnosyltransferase [Aeromonas caviae]